MTNAEVGARIRLLRQDKGWSQMDLGHRLDPPRSHAAVSDIERGKTRLDVEDLSRVAGLLGTTPANLLGLSCPYPHRCSVEGCSAAGAQQMASGPWPDRLVFWLCDAHWRASQPVLLRAD